jgi:hypothetical protein
MSKTKDEINEYQRRWCKANPDKVAKAYKKWSEKNKDKISLKDQLYRINNEEKIRIRQQRYRNKNKEKLNNYQREYYSNNIEARFKKILRVRINQALKGINKNNTFNKVLGCTSNALRIYLEAHFKDGMSWDNYGYRGWHIDHIKPCSSFDLSDIEQQKQCFHYTNLQPLWAQENMRKSNKILTNLTA